MTSGVRPSGEHAGRLRVLVTGGAGFIGGHVTDVLLDAGHRVRVLDSLLPAAWRGAAPQLDPRAEFVADDVTNPAAVAAAIRDIDVVCHLAAMVGIGVGVADQPAFVANNDLGTSVVLAAMAAAGVGRLVLASSMVVYGEGAYRCREHGQVRPSARRPADLEAGRFEPRCPWCEQALDWAALEEDAPLEPRSTYAATKTAQEHLAGAWQRETGGSVVALRYHNVYGAHMPRDTPYAGVAAIFRSALEAGRAPHVFEDGGQTRDFVHVGDVASATATAAGTDCGAGYLALNIASGHPTTVLEMATILAGAMDGPRPVVTGRYRASDVRHIVASPERATQVLGFRAAVSPVDGIKAFAQEALRGGSSAAVAHRP